jgi:hypothetical protein
MLTENQLRNELSEFLTAEKYLISHQNDKNKLKEILNLRPTWYKFLSPKLKEDFDLIKICVQKSSKIFKFIPQKYQQDSEFILENVHSPPFHLLDQKLKENKEIMKKILRIHPKYLKNTNIIFDDDFYVELLKKNYSLFQFMIDHPRRYQYKFLKIIIDKSPAFLDCIHYRDVVKLKIIRYLSTCKPLQDLTEIDYYNIHMAYPDGYPKNDYPLLVHFMKNNSTKFLYSMKLEYPQFEHDKKKEKECLIYYEPMKLQTSKSKNIGEEAQPVKIPSGINSPLELDFFKTIQDRKYLNFEIFKSFTKELDIILYHPVLGELLKRKKWWPFPFKELSQHPKFCKHFYSKYFGNLLDSGIEDLHPNLLSNVDFLIENISKISFSTFSKYIKQMPLVVVIEFMSISTEYHIRLATSEHWENELFCNKFIQYIDLNRLNEMIEKNKNLLKDKSFILSLSSTQFLTIISSLDAEFVFDFDLMTKFFPLCDKEFYNFFKNQITQEIQTEYLKLFPYQFKLFSGFDDDKEIIIKAIEISNDSYYHASERLKKDRDVILTLIKQYGMKSIEFPELLTNDEEFVRFSIESCPFVLKHLKKEFQNRKEFVSTCALKIPLTINYASEELKKDENFIFDLCLKNREIYYHISEEFKKLSYFKMMMEGKLYNLHPSKNILLDIKFDFQ